MKKARPGYTKGQLALVIGLGIIIVILATILMVVPPKNKTKGVPPTAPSESTY